jgi:hypothetical protein
MLVRLLPYVKGQKQATSLFAFILLLGMTRTFDAPHLHIESAPVQPTMIVTMAATSTVSTVTLDSNSVSKRRLTCR